MQLVGRMVSQIIHGKALEDIYSGLKLYPVYTLLAWTDVKNRYRRTKLGPFWLTISMGVFIAAVGLLYAGIFGNRGSNYIPYFGTGVIIWTYLNNTVQDQCDTFINSTAIAQNIDIPRSIFIFRTLVRSLIVLAHNCVIIILLLLIFKIEINLSILSSFGGIILISLNGLFVGMLFGIMCLRYRDLPHMIASGMQIMFFLTPILWQTSIFEITDPRVSLISLNPFYHFIEIVRLPLIAGEVASSISWSIALFFTSCFGLMATYFYHKKFRRIGLWL